MKIEEKQRVADTLSERKYWVRVGIMFFRIRPLTLWQIYEMGAAANDIDSEDLQQDGKVNMLAVLLKHANDAKAMVDVFCICAMRSRLKRWLLKRYIRKRLTSEIFAELITKLMESFSPNFFLTSIIFLTQAKIMTEPNQTILHGQSLAE